MQYSPVLSEGNGREIESASTFTRGIYKRCIAHALVYYLIIIAVSMITGVFLLLDRVSHIREENLRKSDFYCGQSASEARALGCNFDVMSFSWLPSACFDEVLMDDFLKYRNWTWSRDKEGSDLISESIVREGDFEFLFTNLEYHVVHCTYMWKKMHRALSTMDFTHIDGYIASTHHTDHCGEILLDKAQDSGSWGTIGITKFPLCGPGVHRVFNGQQGWYRIHNGEKIWGMEGIQNAVFQEYSTRF